MTYDEIVQEAFEMLVSLKVYEHHIDSEGKSYEVLNKITRLLSLHYGLTSNRSPIQRSKVEFLTFALESTGYRDMACDTFVGCVPGEVHTLCISCLVREALEY